MAGATPNSKAIGAGQAPVTVTDSTEQHDYWADETLNLAFIDKTQFSVDGSGAKKHKLKANAPHDYVVQLQKDLVTLGYLIPAAKYRDGLYEASTQRAVLRFQRHAARPYRMPGPDAQPEVKKEPEFKWHITPFLKGGNPFGCERPVVQGPGPWLTVTPDTLFTGRTDGVCDHATAREIRKWIAKGFKLPVGRFPLRAVQIKGLRIGQLREDVADAWDEIVRLVEQKGGTLEGPYGDVKRGIKKSVGDGASVYSFHCCGRAVDINQTLGNKRYFIVKEMSGNDVYWRTYCKTEKQDGTQGTKFTKGQVKCYAFQTNTEFDIPAGYYIDLTALIESKGTFERIRAHKGWEKVYKRAEWWHYQYTLKKEKTFLDEVELIGVTEKQLRDLEWTTEMMDHSPG